MLEYLKMTGYKADVVEKLSSVLGTSKQDSLRIFSLLLSDSLPFRGRNLIESHESGDTQNLLADSGLYYINIKISALNLLALLLDIAVTKGAFAAGLQIAGTDMRGIVKLSPEKGETCVVRESLCAREQTVSLDLFKANGGECVNNDLPCHFRKESVCKCQNSDIEKILTRLEELNVYERQENGTYRLNM